MYNSAHHFGHLIKIRCSAAKTIAYVFCSGNEWNFHVNYKNKIDKQTSCILVDCCHTHKLQSIASEITKKVQKVVKSNAAEANNLSELLLANIMASRVSLEILSRLWTYAFDSRIWLNIVHGYVFICWAQNGDTVSIFSIVGRVTLLITCVLLVISTFQGFNFIRRKCLPLVPFSFCNSNALDLFLFWFFFILNQTRVINFSDLKKKTNQCKYGFKYLQQNVMCCSVSLKLQYV